MTFFDQTKISIHERTSELNPSGVRSGARNRPPLAAATQDCSIRLTGISFWRSTVIQSPLRESGV
jgi:hypothetical protein